MLLLTINPKALGQTVSLEPDIILNQGQLSPYLGVLVSPGAYRSDTALKLEAQDFKSNENKYVVCPAQAPTVNLFSPGGFTFVLSLGIASFIAGAVYEHNH